MYSHWSLTVSVLDCPEHTALVRCMIHTDTGTIISATPVSLPVTPSAQANMIGCAVEQMLSTHLPMAMITTNAISDPDAGDDVA